MFDAAFALPEEDYQTHGTSLLARLNIFVIVCVDILINLCLGCLPVVVLFTYKYRELKVKIS